MYIGIEGGYITELWDCHNPCLVQERFDLISADFHFVNRVNLSSTENLKVVLAPGRSAYLKLSSSLQQEQLSGVSQKDASSTWS